MNKYPVVQWLGTDLRGKKLPLDLAPDADNSVPQ